LVLRNKTYTDDEFIEQLGELKSIVISGNAGSGKSMFMRYLFVALCEKGYGRIPLFVELRNLNSFAVKELFSWPAPGSEDTELGVFMGQEVGHGEAEVYARVQA
jgi:hypothetical protein